MHGWVCLTRKRKTVQVHQFTSLVHAVISDDQCRLPLLLRLSSFSPTFYVCIKYARSGGRGILACLKEMRWHTIVSINRPAGNRLSTCLSLASFPGFPTVQFLITFSIFAHGKWSKTGQWEGLGMRLVYPLFALTRCHSYRYAQTW